MKKLLSTVICLLILCGTLPVCAASADNSVYVTISDQQGEIVVPYEKIALTDTDNDNKLTVNDALSIAHKEFFENGADGYASATTEYGLSLTKLWGVEGAGYGYQLNDASCMSLTDEVKNGDYIAAYFYTDTQNWSDAYSYFDTKAAQVNSKETISLTLTKAGFDADFAPITSPCENAQILINGEKSDYKTDSNGKVDITLQKSGTYVISAVSESDVLVPPISVVTVNGGNSALLIVLISVIAVIVVIAAVLIAKKRNSSNEK